ncbi:MAG: hypothetical protein J1E38_05740 [Paramuribaculum sp.]|nr:hypothetical protein [Paramuribaculum sp.]
MRKFHLLIIIIATLFSVASFDVYAQKTFKFNTLSTDVYKNGKLIEQPSARQLEIDFNPRIGNQPPLIKFSVQNASNPSRPYELVWFKQNVSHYHFHYFTRGEVSQYDCAWRYITLYSSEFDNCVRILEPMKKNIPGLVLITSKTTQNGNQIFCWVSYDEIVRIMRDVCREVQRLNLKRTKDSMYIDIDW